MANVDCGIKKLTIEFDELVQSICDQPSTVQHKAIEEFRDKLTELEHVHHVNRLVNIYKAKKTILVQLNPKFYQGQQVNDHSTKVEAGGNIDMTGSAVGHEAKVTAQIIQSLKGNVDTAANFDVQGQQLYKDAVDEIAKAEMEEEIRAELLADFEKLQKTISSDKPKPTILKKCWDGIMTLGGALPKIMAFGAWMKEKWPEVFGQIPTI